MTSIPYLNSFAKGHLEDRGVENISCIVLSASMVFCS